MIIGLVIGIAIVGVVVEMLFGARYLNTSSKEALRRMHEELNVGFSKDEVLSVYERNKTARTKFVTDSWKDTWDISMPFEFGATDWVLYVQFDCSAKVTSLVMRTSDGIHNRPRSSPQDKGDFHIPEAGR